MSKDDALNLLEERFQCSSASRKFLNLTLRGARKIHEYVSVLFSEPKIPQCNVAVHKRKDDAPFQCSSASRKFLNSSARHSPTDAPNVSVLFSEPKIPQFDDERSPGTIPSGFSALQRAENSSIRTGAPPSPRLRRFQCSSASRKFLNHNAVCAAIAFARVSVLFSEPKIPQ